MRKRKLGTTDTMVSPICLGCMGFGEPEHGQHQWTLDYEHTYPILKKARETGSISSIRRPRIRTGIQKPL